MTVYYLNFESALHAIEMSTKQTCNHFTVLHYLTNGYLNLYFKYTGELYEKCYKSIVSEKYDENDFLIVSTEKVTETFLKIKLPSLNDKQLYHFLLKETKLKVSNVHKASQSTTYHLLQDDHHQNFDFYDEDLFNAYIDLLSENGDIANNLLMKDSKGKELTHLNRYEFLTLNEVYFSSEEIEELIVGIKQDQRSNLIIEREKNLANKILVQFFSNQLLKIKPELSKIRQSKIITQAMRAINRPLSERTILDQLKEKTD